MTEDFMKSALDRAMERADRIQVPEEKLKEMSYRSEAERIAAGFLREPQYDLAGAVAGFDADKAQQIARGVVEILLRNVVLPKKEADMAANDRMFAGLYSLKRDKGALDRTREQLKNLAGYYTQARKQHYDQLKAEVERALAQAIRQQTGGQSAGMKFNVEQTQEFQENWRQISARLDAEYENALAELKQQILGMA